jgi:uncharacterized membrane protein
MGSEPDAATPTPDPAGEPSLPFVAPCHTLAATAPLDWVRHGWRDLCAAPRQSLAYGAVVIIASLAVAGVALRYGGYFELLVLISGFVLVAPLLAIGTYAISRRLEQGEPPSLADGLAEAREALGNLAVFALILMVVFLVWARAASGLHVFFPVDDPPTLAGRLRFYGIGSAVGAIFAAVVFSAAAFSLPMLVDRRTDTVTAVVTSVNAVLRNKPAMLVWAICIGLAVLPGLSLLAIGRAEARWLLWFLVLLGITLPLIGHATWHGYRETVDASAWEPRGVEGSPVKVTS